MLKIRKFNKIIVANWKLNGSNDFLEAYFEKLVLKNIDSDVCGIICPPITYFQNCYSKLNSLYLGAQDCSKFKDGAFTDLRNGQTFKAGESIDSRKPIP